jgi:hypothetical protein
MWSQINKERIASRGPQVKSKAKYLKPRLLLSVCMLCLPAPLVRTHSPLNIDLLMVLEVVGIPVLLWMTIRDWTA